MIQHQCQDCDFTTYDDAAAENHQKDTDHCLTEVEVWDSYEQDDDVAAQDGAKLAQLGAMLDRAKKGLPPLSTERKTRAPRKPKTETPRAEKKPHKKKDKKDAGTGDLILRAIQNPGN